MTYSQKVKDRFLAKAYIGAPEECWPWKGNVGSGGYGSTKLPDQATPMASSRASYMLFVKWIPRKVGQICHTCDNRRCVNPNHLWLGDGFQNMQDAARKGRLGQHKKGVRPHNAVLTLAAANDIRRRRFAGERAMDLSREYGVSRGQIGGIMCHIYWPDSTMPTYIEFISQRNEEIHALRRSGLKLRELGSRFNMSVTHIKNILAGRYCKKADGSSC